MRKFRVIMSVEHDRVAELHSRPDFLEKKVVQSVEQLRGSEELNADDRERIASLMELMTRRFMVQTRNGYSIMENTPVFASMELTDRSFSDLEDSEQVDLSGLNFEDLESNLQGLEDVAMKAVSKPRVPGVSPGYSSTVLLQGFHWNSWKNPEGWYKVLEKQAELIAQTGFTHIWMNPPSKSVADEGYLPTQLYNLETPYGSQEDLKECLAAFKKVGVQTLADIVVNHRCADKQDEHGQWTIYSDEIDHSGAKLNWGKWAICGDDPAFGGHGNADTGESYGAAPDLDHTNPELRRAIVDWLNFLKDDIGFDGWRFDFAKGYGPNYITEYVRETVGSQIFCVGELWYDCLYDQSGLQYNQNAHRQLACNWVDASMGHSAAFDFTTKAILQEAVKGQLWRLADSQGKPPGMIGWWPTRAVTFLDNHDTGGSQNHWPFPKVHMMMGYCYILTHPGIPTVFYTDLFDLGYFEQISALIATRKRNLIKAESLITIKVAKADLYIAEVTGLGGKILVKMGTHMEMGENGPTKDMKLVCHGVDYAVWEELFEKE